MKPKNASEIACSGGEEDAVEEKAKEEGAVEERGRAEIVERRERMNL